MKKFKYYLYLFVLFISNSPVLATSEAENIKSALKTTGYEPNYFSIMLSLVFVVFLIYVTGIIYTKLNKISIKTIKKELKESVDIKPVILSTTPIGHDKSLQVIEIDNEKLLIGVSQHSISLIKSLGRTSYFEEKNNISEQPVFDNKIVESNENKNYTINEEDFGLYKKYLR